VEEAEEDGLLAIGGDLSINRLITAYSMGIFPWFNEGDPPLWWCPNPRCVIFTHKVKISKSMKQILKKTDYTVTFNQAFEEVILSCQKVKRNQDFAETWITSQFIESYTELYKMGLAFSVEVWKNKELVGGLYGVKLGAMFYGESMFSKESNTSKIAFIRLCQLLQSHQVEMIDCQINNPHLESLGAEMIDGQIFREKMNEQMSQKFEFSNFISFR
jgi:leucyl/phenylalanyl-tRNA--protein transferase